MAATISDELRPAFRTASGGTNSVPLFYVIDGYLRRNSAQCSGEGEREILEYATGVCDKVPY